MLAAQTAGEDIGLVTALVQLGVHIDESTGRTLKELSSGESALVAACKAGHIKIVNLLLQQGATVTNETLQVARSARGHSACAKAVEEALFGKAAQAVKVPSLCDLAMETILDMPFLPAVPPRLASPTYQIYAVCVGRTPAPKKGAKVTKKSFTAVVSAASSMHACALQPKFALCALRPCR